MTSLRRALRGGDGREVLPVGEALHPATLVALALLVLNDWVLKPAFAHTPWAHAITGKLSDLAGLAAAPVILTALVGLLCLAARRLGARVDPFLTQRRLLLAILATGVAFAAVKLSATAAAWFVALLSHVRPAAVMVDATDLLCLPALAIAWAIGRDELRRLGQEPTGSPRTIR